MNTICAQEIKGGDSTEFWSVRNRNPKLAARFEQQYRNGGLAPAIVAYFVLVGVFLVGPVATIWIGYDRFNDVIAWRVVALQMICIGLAFVLLRLALPILILAALVSSVAVLLLTFDSHQQRLVGAGALATILAVSTGVWFAIYRRERLLFRQSIMIQAAAETERKFSALAHQERRSLIHDIRQPMSAFAIHMGILRTTQALTPELEQKLATLGFAFDALTGQVDELARESQDLNEAKAPAPALEWLDVTKVVSNTVQLHEPLAASKSIALTAVCRPAQTSCMVRTNVIQLSNVLQLLVGNAIKFNEGATVRVSCKVCDKRCAIHVTDTGPGIESANLERIFDAGFSTGPDDSDSQGLGLFNVQRIIASLPGHRVRVRSTQGRYTSFKLTLPLATNHSQALNSVRLLIVDDEPTILSGLSTLFKSYGATVVTAGSAEQAIDLVLADDLAFEILICDHDLGPGSNGLMLIREIRAYYDVEMPAILITGRRSQIGPIPKSVQVVSKPFDADKLLRMTERYLETLPATVHVSSS